MSTVHYDFIPDAGKVAHVIETGKLDWELFPSLRRKITFYYKDGKNRWGTPNRKKLLRDWDKISQIDIDFFYRPGNPSIRFWSYLELHLTKSQASISLHGDPDWSERNFKHYVTALGLKKARRQLWAEKTEAARLLMDSDFLKYIEGPLSSKNFQAALNAAVIYVEDRLRTKLGSRGIGKSGAELVSAAYKPPDAPLQPPLLLANNADEAAFLMIRGWVGYVRNLHGHKATFECTDEEGFAQLLGISYILWIVNNSTTAPQELA